MKALGLCHGVIGVAQQYAEFFGAELADCEYVNAASTTVPGTATSASRGGARRRC